MRNHLRLALILSLGSFLTTGCVVVHPTRPVSSKSSAMKQAPDKCPPGHRWSDGRCHDRGKGHDPAKHAGKGNGKHKGDKKKDR